jgi:aspartate/methionine/tyrosine aminotransferase
MQIAERMTRIGIESAFEVLQRARALEAQGKHVIHLEIGQPDFPTPAHIKDAAKKALDDGWTGYGPTPGFPDFREAIASYISTTRGIRVSGQNVVVVPGGKPIMFFAMLAVVEPGDEVIYPNPGFPIYESVINFLGATPVPIPLVESRGFSFDLDTFAAKLSPRTKMIVLNSPANPTGGVMPKEDLKRIADLTRDLDVLILSDEIYSRICYEDEPQSITQFDGMLEKTIILDGFSKTYSMTGWRLGYGVMPLWLVDAMDKLMVNSNSVHGELHAARRPRGVARSAGRRDRDGRGIPPPARRDRQGSERDSRIQLHRAGRRVLRFPRTSRTRACPAASWRTCC